MTTPRAPAMAPPPMAPPPPGPAPAAARRRLAGAGGGAAPDEAQAKRGRGWSARDEAQAMDWQADEAAMSEVLADVLKDDIPLRQALHCYLSRSYKATVIKEYEVNKEGRELFAKAWLKDTLCRYWCGSSKAGGWALELRQAVSIFRKLLHRGLGPHALVSNLGLPEKEWPFVERGIRELFKTWSLPEEGIPTYEDFKEMKERTGPSARDPPRVEISRGASDLAGDGKWLHDKFNLRREEKKMTVVQPAETDQPDGEYEYTDESEEEEEKVVEETYLAAFAGEIEVKEELAFDSQRKYTNAEVGASKDRLREPVARAASIRSETPLLDALALSRTRRTAAEGKGGGKCEVGTDKSLVAKERPERRVLLRGWPEVEQEKKRGYGKLQREVAQLIGKDAVSKRKEDAEPTKVKGLWALALKTRTPPTESAEGANFALSDPYL